MVELIKELSILPGPSGMEDLVRDRIIKEIEGHCDYHIDALGNLIAFKKGRQTPKNRTMLAAHMDEVGFIITHIEESGLLRFANVGGIDTRVIVGKRLRVGPNNLLGVIGTKPVHLVKGDERDKMPDPDSFYIDIGAVNKDDALRHVSPGDCAVFDSEFVQFGDGLIKGKALDDRAGCAIMIKMIKSQLEYDTYFAFNVQEEVGCRGAVASAYTIKPDCAIVLEATTAADIAGVASEKEVCCQGDGPVISFMDKGTVYDRALYRMAFEVAREKGIPCQPKRLVAGGNEASAIHKSRAGVRTLSLSMPCRYLHSPACVLRVSDIDATYQLAAAAAERMCMEQW